MPYPSGGGTGGGGGGTPSTDILENVGAGQIPAKASSGETLVNSGAQLLPDGQVLMPANLGVEGASIDFGDVTTLSEANSFLRIANAQFTATRFDLIDARERPTGASSAPRQFFLTEAETDLVGQPVSTETLTANPLVFNYTATGTRQVNKVKLSPTANMSNVRIRVKYATGNQVAIKYWPTKAAWLSGTGGGSLTAGDDVEVDLEGSPFRVIAGDQYTVEIRANDVSLKGDTNGVPRIVFVKQDAEFRDLPFKADTIKNIVQGTDQETLTVTLHDDTTRMLYLRSDVATLYNARNSTNTAIPAGSIVCNIGVGIFDFETDGVEYIDVIRDRGALSEHETPIGVTVKEIPANSQVRDAIFRQGAIKLTIPGQNDLPLGSPIYIALTGTGANQRWEFTHVNTANSFLVGNTVQDNGVNTYDSFIDFSLFYAHEVAQNIANRQPQTLDIRSNGTVIDDDATALNFQGTHHDTSVNNGVVTVRIDPGRFMLLQQTGSVFQPGQPARLSGFGDGEVVVNVIGSAGQWPEFWCGEPIASGSTGDFVREGRINNVALIEKSAGNMLLQPSDTFATDFVFWNQPSNIFTLDDTSNYARCGSIISSEWKRDVATSLSSDISVGNVGISTAETANAARNATILVPTVGTDVSRAFQIPNLSANQPYTTPFQVGDQIAFVNPPNSNITLDIDQQAGGTFQSATGTNIANYVLNENNSVVIERIANNIWKVVAENSDVVQVDMVVSLDKLLIDRDRIIENSVPSDLTSELNEVRKSHFVGLNTEGISASAVRVNPGVCGSDDGTSLINVTSNLDIDIASMLDTGSEAADTWYYIWLFKANTGDTVVGRLSTSSTNPTAPANHTAKRLIGAVRNDSSSNFEQFWARGAGRSKDYVYKIEHLLTSNQTISARTTIDASSQAPNMPSGGYPFISVIFQFAGTGNLLTYHANQNTTFGYFPAAGNDNSIEVSNINLTSSGEFHVNNTGGTITGLYTKVSGFKMEL